MIVKTIDNVPLTGLIDKIKQQQKERIGVVKRVFFVQGSPYAYIHCEKDDYFVSSRKNKKLNFKNLKGKTVSFILSLKDGKERVQALNVKVINE